MNTSWLGPEPLMVGVLGGRLSFQEELGLPFEVDVAAALRSLGIADETTALAESRFPALPKFGPNLPPIASLGLDDLIIGFGIYMAGVLSDAVAGRIADQIYEACVQPAIVNLKTKLRRSRNRPRATRVLFDHWFDGSGVLVRIEFLVEDGGEYPDVAAVRSVLLEAARWVNSNPLSHRVLTFTAEHGTVHGPPRLSEPI